MSTTIAVMNKLAVALASDSAHTFVVVDRREWEEIHKTFNTGNRLFRLSDATPVGIMQYGRAQLLGVPLETIFSMYKDHLGGTRFSRLEDYKTDFVRFLEENPPLFPSDVQESFMREKITEHFEEIREENVAKDSVRSDDEPDDHPLYEDIKSKIEERVKDLSKLEPLGCFSEPFVSNLLKKKQQLFDEVAKSVFENDQLSGSMLSSLQEIGGLVTKRFLDPYTVCRIVFAGYGDKDIFPHLIALEVDGVIDGHLRYRETVNERVNTDAPAHVISFGEDEMIRTFLDGVNPDHLHSLIEVRDSVKFFGVPVRGGTLMTSLPKVEEKLEALINKSSSHRGSIIFNVVSSLPQADLAKVAEELIKLECLSQRLSEEHEFTGEPVDVALITKSGFTWVKNKNGAESGSNRAGALEAM